MYKRPIVILSLIALIDLILRQVLAENGIRSNYYLGISYSKKNQMFYILTDQFYLKISDNLIDKEFLIDRIHYRNVKRYKFENEEIFNLFHQTVKLNLNVLKLKTIEEKGYLNLFDQIFRIDEIETQLFIKRSDENLIELDKNRTKLELSSKLLNECIRNCLGQTLKIKEQVYCFLDTIYYHLCDLKEQKLISKLNNLKIEELFNYEMVQIENNTVNYENDQRLEFIFNLKNRTHILMTQRNLFILNRIQIDVDKKLVFEKTNLIKLRNCLFDNCSNRTMINKLEKRSFLNPNENRQEPKKSINFTFKILFILFGLIVFVFLIFLSIKGNKKLSKDKQDNLNLRKLISRTIGKESLKRIIGLSKIEDEEATIQIIIKLKKDHRKDLIRKEMKDVKDEDKKEMKNVENKKEIKNDENENKKEMKDVKNEDKKIEKKDEDKKIINKVNNELLDKSNKAIKIENKSPKIKLIKKIKILKTKRAIKLTKRSISKSIKKIKKQTIQKDQKIPKIKKTVEKINLTKQIKKDQIKTSFEKNDKTKKQRMKKEKSLLPYQSSKSVISKKTESVGKEFDKSLKIENVEDKIVKIKDQIKFKNILNSKFGKEKTIFKLNDKLKTGLKNSFNIVFSNIKVKPNLKIRSKSCGTFNLNNYDPTKTISKITETRGKSQIDLKIVKFKSKVIEEDDIYTILEQVRQNEEQSTDLSEESFSQMFK